MLDIQFFVNKLKIFFSNNNNNNNNNLENDEFFINK